MSSVQLNNSYPQYNIEEKAENYKRPLVYFFKTKSNQLSLIAKPNQQLPDECYDPVTMEILKYSGVIIKDPQIFNVAAKELAEDQANEKR